MAKEIHYYGTSGQTLYAVALTTWFGSVWNTTDFGNEGFNVSHWADYAIPMTEVGAGIYFGDAPLTGGKIFFVIYQQAGGAPATTDAVVGKFEFEANPYTEAPITDAIILDAIISAVPDPVNARVIGWTGKRFPYGEKTSVSGNDITVSWTEGITDSNSAAYVGWAVWFELTISGYPPYYVPWLTTVVSHSGNTITVAAMPPQDLTYKSFTVYLFPPGFAAGGGGGASVGDIVAGLQSADPPIPADVVEWKSEGAPEMTGDAYARLGAPAGASVSADIAAVKSDTGSILEDTGTTLPGLFAASGAIVTVVSPVASAGSATVYQGDDYAAGDGRALEWSGTTWADLTAALSVTLYVRAPDGSLFSVEGSVVSAGGVTQTVRFELTDDDTAMLVAWPSSSELRIRAVLASGGKATLVDTTLLVIEDVA